MKPYILGYVSGHLKTDEMCETAAEEASCLLKHVLNQYKTKEMCEKTVEA